MNPDTLFSAANYLAILGWALLLIVPSWKYTKPIVQGGLISLLLSLLYAYLIFTNWGSVEGGFGSLDEVASLFSNKHLLLAGWVHYLAFDLWIGSWEAGDAVKNNIHRLIMVPCLLLTFIFGPIGLLLYLVIRMVKTKSIVNYENFVVDNRTEVSQ